MRMHYHDGLLTGTCARECTQGVHVGSRVSLGSLRQPLVRELFSRPVVGQTSRCGRVVVAWLRAALIAVSSPVAW